MERLEYGIKGDGDGEPAFPLTYPHVAMLRAKRAWSRAARCVMRGSGGESSLQVLAAADVSLDGTSGAALVRTVKEEIKHRRSAELARWLRAIFLECVKKREWSNTRYRSANGQVERR